MNAKDSVTKKQLGSKVFDSNLKNQIKGTGITLTGSLIGSIFALVGTILIARHYTVSEYGLFRLNIAIISSFIYITSLGLSDGTPVFISRYRGQGNQEYIKGTICSSFYIFLMNSVVVALLLFFSSDFISEKIFHIKNLSTSLKIMSICLPFWMLLSLMVSIYRGFESTKENVLFGEPMFRALRLPLFVIVIFWGLSFDFIFLAYITSILIVFLFAILYYRKTIHTNFSKIDKHSKMTKSLLSFSLPLVFSYLGWFMIKSADKWLIGIFYSEYEVGIYSAAATLIEYLNFFLVALIFIYQPMASRLLGEGSFEKLKNYYSILTKWLYTISLPLISIFLINPNWIITLIFGEKYIFAAPILQILTIGSLVHILAGPNQQTLIALGKTKLIMYFTLPCGILNIATNALLLPRYGILITAIISSSTYIVINLFNSIFLYKLEKIAPINKDNILPILFSIIFLPLIYYFRIIYLSNTSQILSITVCFLPFIAYIFIIYITKSWNKEDFQLLSIILSKLNFNFNIKRVFRCLV